MDKILNQVLLESLRLAQSETIADYEDYVALTNARDILVEQIHSQGPLSGEQKNVLRQILQHDNEIMRRMQIIKQEAESSIQRFNISKKQKNAYGNTGFSESFMFDKKN